MTTLPLGLNLFIEVRDSNESTDTTNPSNRIADSSDTTPFSLVAGYNYRFDINATNHIDNSATPRYRQEFKPDGTLHYIRMEENFSITKSACNDVENKNLSINLYNGSSINTVSNTASVNKVDQIGEYKLVAYDANWTSADWDNLTHHGAPYGDYFKDGSDCITGSSIVLSEDPNDGGKITGCTISSEHSNVDIPDTYNALKANYYPYAFKVDTLTIGARPDNDNSNNTFVYLNTLATTQYPNGEDENMSYNVQGTFTAVGKTDQAVSNFVTNCYAASVDMLLNASYTFAPGVNITFNGDLIDYSTVSGAVVRTRINGDIGFPPPAITQDAQFFIKEMNGSIAMDLGYNFVRTNATPVNPRMVSMKDFNITYTTPPATVYVDMINDHQIMGSVNIDKNVSFMYARAKPAQTYYETTDNNINTPVSVVVYCDGTLQQCADRGIDVVFGRTKDPHWWKSVNHDNIVRSDGNIELLSAPATALNATAVAINNAGENNAINVTNTTGNTPAIVPVNLVPFSIGAAAYTDRWLIYNPENADPLPPLYDVHFMGASSWAGTGDAGHVVGGQSNAKTNRRLEW